MNAGDFGQPIASVALARMVQHAVQELDLGKQLRFELRKPCGEIHAGMKDCQNDDSLRSIIANQNMFLDPIEGKTSRSPGRVGKERRVLRDSVDGG